MSTHPSQPASRLVAYLLPRDLREEALDELADLHELRAVRDGIASANRWYLRHALIFALEIRFASLTGGPLALTPGLPPRPSRRKMGSFLADLRYSARALFRNPAFAVVAVLTMALGIGANTAIFSVVRTVLLRPLPFPEPDRLFQLWETRLDRGWTGGSTFSHANFWDVQDLNRTFEGIGALGWTTFNLTGRNVPERVRGGRISAGFFQTLAVTPIAGRTFAAGEDASGANNHVALVSHGFWKSHFEPGRTVVGQSITLDGESYVVVGVLPAGEPWLNAADVFVPLVHRADADRGSWEFAVIGRLKRGVSLEAARTDLQEISRGLAERYPETDKGMGIALDPSSTWVASESLRRAIWILMGAVGLLLVIACVNLANLFLARATGRAREQALRTALGAARSRIARLVLTESVLVGAIGSALGLALAALAVRLLRAFDPGDIPRLSEVAIDGWVLVFTVVAALVTSIVTGLLPAMRAPHHDLVTALREGERSVAGSRRQGRLRGLLVGTEVALSLILLVGAGLLVRSFGRVMGIDRGFQTEGRLVFEVGVPSSYDGPHSSQLIVQFLSRATANPQVVAAAAVSLRPLRGVGTGMGVGAPGREEPPGKAVPWASWRLTTRDYFKTMGVAVLKGRDFTEHDKIGKPWRAIISHRLAEILWPGQDPIGRTLTMWAGQSNDPAEVIGVVADMRDWGLAGDPSLAVYLPYYGGGYSPVQFVFHASVAPAGLMPALRSILAELDPNLPISDIEGMDEMVAGSVAPRRFTMLLFGSLAAVALLLALAGVYGVLAYAVSNRTAEIGTRMALGASPGSVLRLIVGQAMRPVFIGLTVGVAGALALSRLMSGLLFEVTPGDIPTYAGVAALLVSAAAISCYLPARKAVRVDVVAALRDE